MLPASQAPSRIPFAQWIQSGNPFKQRNECSERYEAPRERSRFHDGLIPACWREMPNFLKNARSLKEALHGESNGFAVCRILT